MTIELDDPTVLVFFTEDETIDRVVGPFKSMIAVERCLRKACEDVNAERNELEITTHTYFLGGLLFCRVFPLIHEESCATPA